MLKILLPQNLILKFSFFAAFFFISISVTAQKEVALANTYLKENVGKYNLTSNDIADMQVSSQYLSPTTGWYHIYFNQAFKNVEVLNSLIGITIKNDKVVNTASNFINNLATKIENKSIVEVVTPIDALQKAIAYNAGYTYNTASLKLKENITLNNGTLSKIIFEDKNLSNENIIVKKYWLLQEQKNAEKIATTIVLIWNVKYTTKDGKHSWSMHVDANTGSILQKIDEVVHCDFGIPHINECTHLNKFDSTSNATNKNYFAPYANGYNVFDYPLESPNHGARTLVSNPYTRFLPATMGPGTTNGWHNDGTTDYTNTRGNTVWAKDDIANDNETTLGSNPVSATLDFNYPYSQTTASAAANLNAAVTNLFYWNNVIHDVLWRYGFDEPSGNFQKDNMGKGGAGNDFVYADAQDGSGTNNANFSTPADGGNGRMQMFIWSNAGSPSYQPDSDFDNGVIGHEYGHGWSIRLAGGPANSGCLQNAEQGGEGWGDYNGLMLTTNWAALTPTVASANIPRGIGTYVFGQSPSTGAGIRPYRYSYNKTVVNNVVTYGKVADATNFSLPHGIGSIWATVLWDMTWEIILQDNFIAPNIYDVPTVLTNMRGNIAAYKLVNEGLRLQPCSPSFVQARDAIFQADLLLFGGRYRCAIGKAFARRGLGLNATTGVSTNDRIVTEDFTPFPGPALSSPTNITVCSKQFFNYTATVAAIGAYTFAWARPAVTGISNTAASGSTATINETLINTTTAPITVTYLITVSPDECGGTPAAQSVRVIVNPSVTPTIANYNVCQNSAVPAGEGLVAPEVLSKILDGTLVAGTTYNRGSGTTTYTAVGAGASGSSVYFKAYSFVSPVTASVTFSTTAANLAGSTDTYLALYQTAFNPASPGTNFLQGDDDAGAGTLSLITQAITLGTTYIVVVSSYTNNVTGTFTLESSADVFPGINNWYTAASGGTAIASTNIFNPIGIAGSGIANTATAGTSLFYVANSLYPNCRTATTFNIVPTTIYVNQSNSSGVYNGTSWATAFTNLQDALNYTPQCTPLQIWVAAGTYKPTSTLDRTISFSMKNNVAIYGGFANTGNPTFTQRNVVDNITILSGDIGLQNNNTDNSYHVISNTEGLTNTAILDGFTIANGNANLATGFNNIGAGMYNDGGITSGTCNPKIDNCTFINNTATNGGAMYNKAQNSTASPTITNCIFTNNTATNGAAIYTDAQTLGTSSPVITNCTFTNNNATNNGSVLFANNNSGTANTNITNTILWGNGGSKSLFINNATINLNYSMVEPLVNNYINGAGNLTSIVSPFISANNFLVKESSTAVDAGTSVGAPTTDATLANRIALPDMGAFENIQCCNGFNKIYYSDISGDTYQWQMNSGSGFVNISNGALYANTNNNKLTVINPAFITTGNTFRCVVTTSSVPTFSTEIKLRFYNRWLGTIDNNWLNAGNWSCGILPNQYTDVIIPNAKTIYPLVNVSGSVRTLQTEAGSNVTITAGNNFLIVGQ